MKLEKHLMIDNNIVKEIGKIDNIYFYLYEDECGGEYILYVVKEDKVMGHFCISASCSQNIGFPSLDYLLSEESIVKRPIGMYGETPKIVIGNFSICLMDPEGDNKSIWIEKEDISEGGEFSIENFNEAIRNFYDKNL